MFWIKAARDKRNSIMQYASLHLINCANSLFNRIMIFTARRAAHSVEQIVHHSHPNAISWHTHWSARSPRFTHRIVSSVWRGFNLLKFNWAHTWKLALFTYRPNLNRSSLQAHCCVHRLRRMFLGEKQRRDPSEARWVLAGWSMFDRRHCSLRVCLGNVESSRRRQRSFVLCWAFAALRLVACGVLNLWKFSLNTRDKLALFWVHHSFSFVPFCETEKKG